MEDAYLVPAILWLVQTILGTLGIRELDSWIQQAGLQDDMENLRSELEVVQAVASDAKGRTTGSARLAKSLADLKRFLYDADDLVDELDYWRLQHQVEGGQDALPSSSNAYNRFASDGVSQLCTAATATTGVTLQEFKDMLEAAGVDHGTSRDDNNVPPTSSSRGKKRSKAWDDFVDIKDGNGKTVQAECRHCKKRVQYKGAQGPRVLTTHVNSNYCKNTRQARPQPPSHSRIDDATENATPVATSNPFSRERMGTNQEPTQITGAGSHPWNKDELSKRIQKITHQLQGIRGDVTKDLNMLGSHSGASSGNHQSTASDPRQRTSSLLLGKMHGRDEEKNSIIMRMTAGKSDSVTVVPIVGIGGTGKTALAQFVYNDPKVQNQFDHKIWVWVSNSFDEMRLTREMLDIVPREKHEGLCSFDKLQQVLKTHIESKRILLILDDVWDDKDNDRLDLILAPFKSDNTNGNVILVTTRNLSVAKRIGTAEPVVLRALKDEDLWLLLKARAFLDENYEGHRNLTDIGQKIAGKLKGNPLAAVTAGELLRADLTVDHWIKILKDENGKLLGCSGGIMAALKLSYDHLPYHLHQCFSYSSIFPESYQFLGEELVNMWISQGFVTRSPSSGRLEEIGMDYLADLVNLGYFQKVERKDSSVGGQNSYVVSGLMHDFARIVSRAECGIVDGLQCNDMLSTVQHLAVVYTRDDHGNLSCFRKFEEDLRNAVTSVRKLRTLLLIGKYDFSFFQSFKDIFQKARDIRLLQIADTVADFNSLVCSSINPNHLRYLKLTVNEVRGDLPQVLRKFCHLQVLDVGSASIARIGKLTSLQKLNNFRIKNLNGFKIMELQSMNELVQLGIFQLHYVETQEEARWAGLIYKRHLEKLHLSWNVTSSEPSTSMETEECLPTKVLEGLKPHGNLKHLQISGYNGATSPSWLASNVSVTSLQTLCLEDCGEWRILPSLRGLPFLAKLSLRNMPQIEVSVPSLEELVLFNMPKLEICSCISLRDLNSCIRILTIVDCPVLKVFDLFHKFKIEQKSWLPRLCELTIKNCRLLVVPHPLPSSRTVCSISVSGVLIFPIIEGSSCGSLTIGSQLEYVYGFDNSSNELLVLDGNILAFHNLRFLTELVICYCKNLRSISLKGLSQLESLTTLKISGCLEFSSFDASPEHAREDLMAANCIALPSLQYLEIVSCGIAWECLSLILRHAPALKRLDLHHFPKLESLQLHSCTALEKLSVRECKSLGTIMGLQSHSLSKLEVWQVPHLESLLLHSCVALEKLNIYSCASLRTLEGFQSLGSLRSLYLRECPGLHSRLVGLPVQDCELCPRLEVLQISDFSFLDTLFWKQLTSLQRLLLWGSVEGTEAAVLTEEQERGLLLLGSLKKLRFERNKHLPEDLRRLHSLQVLEISHCWRISGLPELPPSLEKLRIFGGSEGLNRQSKSLASSKLKVQIDFVYVN